VLKQIAMQSIILGKQEPDYIREESLPQLLSASFIKFADKTAFFFNDEKLSYAELDHWSNAIARQLIATGIKPGDTVGVWYPRSLELPVMILGILKAGAAYIPLDREMPVERIQKVFTDIGVRAYFSDVVIPVNAAPALLAERPLAPVALPELYISPDSRAYVLFTSGSTGTPKGIPISHKNICHLVRSEQDVLRIRESDLVYQGFSVSFDMWCEEVWISLFAGASIWMADAITVKALDELSEVLAQNKITVLHAVPSVLAIIDELPGIRLVNSGGEACTQSVLDKWGIGGRIFINSYGPTETTVSSNMAFSRAGDAITIGPPLPNYNIAVVDESLRIVPRGEAGEMIITGPGVSQGYFNLPELTREKFLENPFKELPGSHLYKTGDAVLIREDGFIEFHGRLDDQIKLRGYRIELGEIENRLSRVEGVSAAAVTTRKDANDQEQLVGYVVWKHPSRSFNEGDTRAQIARFLAPYMVPVAIVMLPEMPRMPSGKINRKSLPLPDAFKQHGTDEGGEYIAPADDLETKVRKVLQHVFQKPDLSLEHDFFTDLGGHSLLAATVVSKLRKDAGLSYASLKDIYEHRPLNAFAAYLKEKQNQNAVTDAGRRKVYEVSTLQYYLCNALQTLSLFLVYGLLAIEVIFPYLSYYYFLVEGYSHFSAFMSAAIFYLLIPPALSTIAIFFKWLIVGKLKEGDYPLWGWYYFRWWFWKALKRLLPSQFIVDTPLYPRYLRFLGVKVADSAQLSLLSIGAEDLVTIGKNVSTSSGCVIDNASVEDGYLKLRKVELGDNAYLGSSSIVCGGAFIEANGELQDLSCLQEGQRILRNEVWNGSPANKAGVKADTGTIPLASTTKRNIHALKYLASLFIFPLIVVIPLLPTLYILYVADNNAADYNFSYLWQAPFLATSYLLIFITCVVLLSRLLQVGMKPGDYSIYGFTYYRKWMKDQLMNLSLTVLHPLYASVYISSYYRLLGAKVGKNTEISTASDVSHNLLEIGADSFIADAVILGEHDVKNEVLHLKNTRIGNTCFVGNSGLIPQGYHLKDKTLIGVLSKAPEEELQAAQENVDWFGSPPIALPSRQKMAGFEDKRTFSPSFGLKLSRAVVEGLRIILPQTCIIICSVLLIAYAHDLLQMSIGKLLLYIPMYYLFFMGIPLFLVTVLLKWVLVGRYKTAAYPMYSLKVWLSEAITSFHEALSVPFLLDALRGTMWLPLAMRLLGVKTGKRVWLNTTDITEFDMVHIGSGAMLNEDCGPQTHLFEDRIMKIGSVSIGEKTTIGSKTIILYDSVLGKEVNIGSLSLVMKGESIPDHSSWYGSPTEPHH